MLLLREHVPRKQFGKVSYRDTRKYGEGSQQRRPQNYYLLMKEANL